MSETVAESEERATGVLPANAFRSALLLALIFGAIKFSLHLFANLWKTHLGWGYFRDEPYYILCGRYLDWGYVDHGPIVALQARMAEMLFGKSPTGIRMFVSLAGGVKVSLCGLLAWQLGARRIGQAIAMSAALVCGIFLAIDSFLSMNAFEPVFWTAVVIAVMCILQRGGMQWWILLGVAAGLGCENKPSMVFFLGAVILGLLVTPQRRILWTKGMLAAVAITTLLALPNLLWQMHHHWATLEFLRNVKADHRYTTPSILAFLITQAVIIVPVSLPIAGAGLLWLILAKRSSPYRFLGFTYIFFLLIMMVFREAGKEYYLAAVYPLLLAAGGAAYEEYAVGRRRWLLPTYFVLTVLSGVIEIPFLLTTITPQQWIAAESFLHVRRASSIRYKPLPDFLAMDFGWQELTDQVTQVYQSLSPEDRARAGICTMDYGTAAAINFLGEGRGLPFAISGHNNFYLWGPHGETGAVMIDVSIESRETLLREYRTVEVIAPMYHPYALRWGYVIYLCRDRKVPLTEDWASKKHYF
jgi:hypothetical protein